MFRLAVSTAIAISLMPLASCGQYERDDVYGRVATVKSYPSDNVRTIRLFGSWTRYTCVLRDRSVCGSLKPGDDVKMLIGVNGKFDVERFVFDITVSQRADLFTPSPS